MMRVAIAGVMLLSAFGSALDAAGQTVPFEQRIAAISAATAREVCNGDRADYASAVCAWLEGRLADAEERFAAIVEAEEKGPETIRAAYFLARSQMKQKKWREASRSLIAVHSLSPAFYWEWNCDFLLGECRRELGEE